MYHYLATNKWLHTFALIALLFSAVYIGQSDNQIRLRMQSLVFDYYNKAKPRPASDTVLIVNIDDESLRRLGQWPWPRTILADMLYKLKDMGALVVAFDGVLAEPDRTSPAQIVHSLALQDERFTSLKDAAAQLPDNDKVLAQAMAKTGFFVSGFTFAPHATTKVTPRIVRSISLPNEKMKDFFLKRVPLFDKAAVFIPALEQVGAGNGSFMASPDFDGILRRVGLVFSDGTDLYPSLSIETLRVGYSPKNSYVLGLTPGYNPYSSLDTPYRLSVGKYAIPVERDVNMLVYYRKFSEHDYVSAYKILEDDVSAALAERIKGKSIFIGSSAEGLKDLRSTPLQPFIPGVEVHANVLEQILQQNFITRPKAIIGVELMTLCIAGSIVTLLASFWGAVSMAFLTMVLVSGLFAISWLSFDHYGILLDSFYPSICLVILFITATLLNYIRIETERRRVKQAFGLYISPDFMKELTAHPDKLQLGGETRELTVMFTDIRNFTSISESLSPEELINLMNDFLTPMSDLVMKRRGTIDKYMGDAMMAFWNAPLNDPDHARHACIAALEMNQALDAINDALAKKGAALQLKAGVGINTGPASVGNMGSRQRFAYSAIGDTVNFASRLESQTKNYGVTILIGPQTQAQVPDFATLELDLIRVKGKTEPLHIYSLLGDADLAARADFQSWRAVHSQMLDAYRSQYFDEAERLLAEAFTIAPIALPELYQLYADRIASLRAAPPGLHWDGAYNAESK